MYKHKEIIPPTIKKTRASFSMYEYNAIWNLDGTKIPAVCSETRKNLKSNRFLAYLDFIVEYS